MLVVTSITGATKNQSSACEVLKSCHHMNLIVDVLR